MKKSSPPASASAPAPAPAAAAAPRTRNAAATRQAILVSARQAFVRLGYDGAGVREIASGAGVTAMLVNRYFGSKEKLFAEVVAETMATSAVVLPKILTPPVSGAVIAAALVEITQTGATPLDGFQMMMRSASSARAAEISRAQIDLHHHADITASLRGAHAAERAALMLSLIAGFQLMRQMVGLASLAQAEPEVLVALLGPVFEQLVHGGDGAANAPPPQGAATA